MLSNKRHIRKKIKETLIKEQEDINIDELEDVEEAKNMVETIHSNIEDHESRKRNLLANLKKQRKRAESREKRRWLTQQIEWYEEDVKQFEENKNLADKLFSIIKNMKGTIEKAETEEEA